MAKKVIKKIGGANNGEYKELVDFLVVKFDEVNGKFDEVNGKFDEVNRKLDQKADKSEVEAVKSEVKMVLDRVVRISDKLDDYRAEQIGLKRQVNKHEKWHFQTAEKVGIDLLKD